MAESRQAPASVPLQIPELAAWIAVGVAFSPVLLDFVRELPTLGGAWSLTLAPALALLVAARSDRVGPAAPRRRSGLACLLLGLALAPLGIASGSWSIARLGLPLAIVGLALRNGRPRARLAALAFFAIPLPTFLFAHTTPEVETWIAKAAAVFYRALGGEIHVGGPVLLHHGLRLEMEPEANGLQLAVVLAEIGWYRGLRLGEELGRTCLRSAGLALLAAPGQLLAVFAAMVLLGAGFDGAASAWLAHGAWLLVAAVGVAITERQRVSGRSSALAPLSGGSG